MLVKLSQSKKFASDLERYKTFISKNKNSKAVSLVKKHYEELITLANKIDTLHSSEFNGVIKPSLARDVREDLISCKRKIDKIIEDSKYL